MRRRRSPDAWVPYASRDHTKTGANHPGLIAAQDPVRVVAVLLWSPEPQELRLGTPIRACQNPCSNSQIHCPLCIWLKQIPGGPDATAKQQTSHSSARD